MRLNADVLSQALRGTDWDMAGPDYRAVLVPEVNGLGEIACMLGIAVYYPGFKASTFFRLNPHLPGGLHDWNPPKRHKLPEFVPDVAAGVPSPTQLTPWKIGALKLLAEIEVKGSVSRNDIRGCGIDPRRWTSADNWLSPIGNGRYVRGSAPRFEDQHPEVYAKIKAKLQGASA